MSLFQRRTGQAIEQADTFQPDFLARLEAFGRFEYDPQGSGVEASADHPNAEYSLFMTAKQDPDRFIAMLTRTALPVGGWTLYGAMRLMWHFGLLKPATPRADADVLGLAALEFVRGTGCAWERLTVDEKALWNRAAAYAW